MSRLARLLGRLAGTRDAIPRRELSVLLGLAALALAVRLLAVILTTDQALIADEREYDQQGRFIADGMWFWSTTPYGNPHPSMWKTPGYPAFVGVIYSLLGPGSNQVAALQALIGSVTVLLTWAVGRRLFDARVGLAAAALVALNPFVWQFEVRLFVESIVTPLTLAFFLVVLERPATARRALGVGVLVGVIILFRPAALYLLPAVAIAWVIATGWRRGTVLTAVTLTLAVVVVAPWTVRNYDVSGSFVPLSVQDAALYGVFNGTSANDPELPYAWRAASERDRDLLPPRRPIADARLREILRERAFEYIREHPASVPKAFFWNGLSRFWDVRRPAHILHEARATNRERLPTVFAIGLHYALLPLALAGLWLARRRPGLVLPILVTALGASVVYTADATTRYRAPLEPLIAVLASFAALELWRRATVRRAAPSTPGES